jgi:hypothetical protein
MLNPVTAKFKISQSQGTSNVPALKLMLHLNKRNAF